MTSGRWNDLRARILSALILLAIAAGSLWLGPTQFGLFVLVLVAAMHWELARMIVTNVTWQGFASAGVAVIASIGVVYYPDPVQQGVIFGVNAVVQAVLVRRMIMRAALYSCAILLAGLVLYRLDVTYGVRAIVWLTGLVVVTDIAGYFAGRIIGGPKFWPRFSPKKTWSGALAGWAAAVGLSVAMLPQITPDLGLTSIVVLAIVLSFCSQMGDIFESAIKRKCDVKDSSNLIPGHGGVLDRMDGIVGAALAFGLVGPWVL
jgi:phosphatidate cytidylyltransferase